MARQWSRGHFESVMHRNVGCRLPAMPKMLRQQGHGRRPRLGKPLHRAIPGEMLLARQWLVPLAWAACGFSRSSDLTTYYDPDVVSASAPLPLLMIDAGASLAPSTNVTIIIEKSSRPRRTRGFSYEAELDFLMRGPLVAAWSISD